MDLSRSFYPLVGTLLVVFLITVFVSPLHAGSTFDASAPEKWGEFQWTSPWIESGGSFVEPQTGQFQISSASLGARWTSVGSRADGPRLEGQMSLGTRSMLVRPLRYAPLSGSEKESDLVLIDAFAGISDTWGRLRLGLQPLLFGLEEGVEAERHWLRPLILRRGLIGLRDVGLGYSISKAGFYSDWLVHNGEGGEDRDREMWLTMRAEYRMRSERVRWRWGFSGQAGRTAVASTQPTGTTPSIWSEIDSTQPARIRFGAAHTAAEWAIGDGENGSTDDRRFGFELMVLGGETAQEARTRRLRSWRLDVEYEPSARLGLLVRGEMLDPDTQVGGDTIHEGSIGVQYFFYKGAAKRTLRALLVGTKEWAETPLVGTSPQRHRVEFVLRFSPTLLTE